MSNVIVSILVPTKNRPHFLPNILRNFFRQDYNTENMELIIADDGDCDMEKIIPDDDHIRYIKLDEVSLGEKRNKLMDFAIGKYLIFFDDDDFYPTEKVSECVRLLEEGKCEVVGSSIMYVYFPKYDDILRYGPWGRNHSTCATIACTKEYSIKNRFPNVSKAEERVFLNNYKTDLIQMNTFKSILVLGHNTNTVDKYKFRSKGKRTNVTLDSFGLTESDKIFYKKLIS